MGKTVLEAFAARLNEVCDDMGVPVRGRQTKLAALISDHTKKLSPNTARKWLLGHGLPELDKVVRIADWAGVNVIWLLQGHGAKRPTPADNIALTLSHGMAHLPPQEQSQVIEFLRYKLEQTIAKYANRPLEEVVSSLERLITTIETQQTSASALSAPRPASPSPRPPSAR